MAVLNDDEPTDPTTTWDDHLYAEFVALRNEDDSWQGRAISLGSFYMVVVSTTAFFLLKEKGQHFPDLVYLAAPVPSFCITALIARQAVTATIRGRWLLAMERRLARSSGTFEVDGDPTKKIPVIFTRHAEQLWLAGRRGVVVTALEYVPLSLLIGLCWLATEQIACEALQWVAIGVYAALLIALVAVTGQTGVQRLGKNSREAALAKDVAVLQRLLPPPR